MFLQSPTTKTRFANSLITRLMTYMVVVILSQGCLGGSIAAGNPRENQLVTITMPRGELIRAELAITPQERSRGLMFRESLPKDRGMLFTFDEARPWTFWMKNTKIPLDIVWMDGKKRIVHIERNVPICTRTDETCPQYQPNEDAVFVLELAGGMADALKLKRGLTLQFRQP